MSNMVAIVTDSIAYLPEENLKKYNIMAVTHANAGANVLSLLDPAPAIQDPFETLWAPLNPVIGTHASPGTVTLNFMSGITQASSTL
jgi:fatty acid-binding protein DegV